MISSGNMSHGYVHRCLLLQTHWIQTWPSAAASWGFTMFSGGRVFTISCSSPSSLLQFQLSSHCSTSTSSLSLPSVRHRHAHCSIVVVPTAGRPCGWQVSGCVPLSSLTDVVASGSLGIYSPPMWHGIRWICGHFPFQLCMVVVWALCIYGLPIPCGR